MRPQRFSCGIRVNACEISYLPACFNEAAAFQLRNLALRRIAGARGSRFNEAAAFQLRNPATRSATASADQRLQ